MNDEEFAEFQRQAVREGRKRVLRTVLTVVGLLWLGGFGAACWAASAGEFAWQSGRFWGASFAFGAGAFIILGVLSAAIGP